MEHVARLCFFPKDSGQDLQKKKGPDLRWRNLAKSEDRERKRLLNQRKQIRNSRLDRNTEKDGINQTEKMLNFE